MKIRNKFIPSLGFLVVALLLALAIGANAAPGDPPFTLVGLLSVSGTPADYIVKGQSFVVVDDMVTTKCTDLALTSVSCATLNGKLVEAEGYISLVDTKYYATSIKEEAPATVFGYTGGLKSFTTALWKINTYDFKVDTATLLPPFFAISDTVVASYTVDTAGDYLAKQFQVLNSLVGHTYSYSGTLKTINATLWTVNTYNFVVSDAVKPPFVAVSDTVKIDFSIVDKQNIASKVTVLASGANQEYKYVGKLTAFTPISWTVGAYSFILGPNITLPPFFGLGDTVEVTFKIIDGKYVATALTITATNVGNKVDSQRCANRVRGHPGVAKFARDLHEDPKIILQYFCSGFGLGEIKLAYRLAKGTQFTPAMLLAMRASGLDWDAIKKLLTGSPSAGTGTQENPVLSSGKPDNSSTGAQSNSGNSGRGFNKGKPNRGKNK